MRRQRACGHTHDASWSQRIEKKTTNSINSSHSFRIQRYHGMCLQSISCNHLCSIKTSRKIGAPTMYSWPNSISISIQCHCHSSVSLLSLPLWHLSWPSHPLRCVLHGMNSSFFNNFASPIWFDLYFSSMFSCMRWIDLLFAWVPQRNLPPVPLLLLASSILLAFPR